MRLPKLNQVKGLEAAHWRQRKYAARRRFRLPDDALPGSLALTHRRCGHPTCHCATGVGHPLWLHTFMVAGKRRVEPIPHEWVEDVRRRVAAGRAAKDTLAELLAANAELLALERKQRSKPRGQPRGRKRRARR